MAIPISTNMASVFATRTLNENWGKVQHSEERLSSGSRINRSADDSAGLAVSERNRANTRSLTAAARGLHDADSMVNTTEGALSTIGDILIRMRELATQGASDTIGDTERGMINQEVHALRDEISRIAETTQFNGWYLLNGTAPTLEVQADAQNNATTSRIKIDPQQFVATLDRLGLEDVSVATKEQSRQALEPIESARRSMMDARTALGALQKELRSSRDNAIVSRDNLAAATSRIRDADYAEETSELVKNKIISHSNAAMHVQAGRFPGQALRILRES